METVACCCGGFVPLGGILVGKLTFPSPPHCASFLSSQFIIVCSSLSSWHRVKFPPPPPPPPSTPPPFLFCRCRSSFLLHVRKRSVSSQLLISLQHMHFIFFLQQLFLLLFSALYFSTFPLKPRLSLSLFTSPASRTFFCSRLSSHSKVLSLFVCPCCPALEKASLCKPL